MFNFIKNIFGNILVKCFSNYYDYEIVSIKKINSTESFIEYNSDYE